MWKDILKSKLEKMPVPSKELAQENTPEAAKKDLFLKLRNKDDEVLDYLDDRFEQVLDPALNERNSEGIKTMDVYTERFNRFGIEHNDQKINFNKHEVMLILSYLYTKGMGYEITTDSIEDKATMKW
jgi:hypothetical protein